MSIRWTQSCANTFYVLVAITCIFSKSSVNVIASRHSESNAVFTRTEAMKYILYWNSADYYPFNYMGLGQNVFLKHNCPQSGCFLSDDRYKFGDITKFDAILFNGRTINVYDKPVHRLPNQVYIYVNTESSKNYPVPPGMAPSFMNWTMTYRLDSEVKWPYFTIHRKGDIVGPKENMHWYAMAHKKATPNADLKARIAKKTLAAAWFVSNCNAMNNRLEYATLLKKNLRDNHNLRLDIYGACGDMSCPRNREQECYREMGRDYYFYLAFENSFAVDYVTEKTLIALNNYAVPIVYGGANYTRFLPPDSYLDATQLTPKQMAKTMASLIHSPDIYERKFLWRSFYTYESKPVGPCELCAALHNKSLTSTSRSYPNLSEWWNK